MARTSLSFLEKSIIGLVLLLANLRAFVFIFLFPDTSTFWGPAWIEILLWGLAAIGVFYLLNRDDQITDFLAIWRRNWLLALFVLAAFVSLLWSVGTIETLFRFLELFFATMIAAYYGMRLGPEKWMDTLFWFGSVVIILSIALVFGAPPTGTMYWAPFNGSWRGVYWHRNHLASIIALLNVIYLCRVVLDLKGRNNRGVLNGFFYILSLVVLYFTGSATGYILFIVLHIFVFGVLIWLQVNHRMRRSHYVFFLGVGIITAVIILSNLDFVFGLFHRDATMTGRIGLWSHLLDIASQRFWLGHGFGAFWMLDFYRERIRQLVGWASQPLIGDNGLLDIYLHLGIIGVVLFVSVLVLATVRAIRYAVSQKTLPGFFPLLVMVYAFVANISFSLFAETEVFVWFLMVAALFMITPSPQDTAT